MGSRPSGSVSRLILLAGLALCWSLMAAMGSASPTRFNTAWARLWPMFNMVGDAAAATPSGTPTAPSASPTTCVRGVLPKGSLLSPPNLIVSGACEVAGGPGGAGNAKSYYYGDINVIRGGSLTFDDAEIDFWAKSIIVENKGSLLAGTPNSPIGTEGKGPNNTTDAVVTINLWGAQQFPTPAATPTMMPQAVGVLCQSPKEGTAPCGIPSKIWDSNGNKPVTMSNGVTDYFYQYQPLMFDNAPVKGKKDKIHYGYFGYKTIGVSYGGTVQLFGEKGATFEANAIPSSPLMTGTSWVRLDQSSPLKPGDTQFKVAGDVTGSTPGSGGAWEKGDDIVVTTTDYLPGHSEKLKIDTVTYDPGTNRSTITLDTQNGAQVQWTHNGSQYDLTSVTPPGGGQAVNVQQRLGLDRSSVDTRAAVGLLSRSIVIQSAGDTIGAPFPPAPVWNSTASPTPTPGYYFGGHMVIRQGFRTVEMQGVEFHQMGQGGEMGHYPVHFHLARKVPAQRAFVKDCSINESMTRWIVLHGTQDVTLARNVGYMSIGHGFMLEDATETDNNIFSNLGVFARAAVINAQNPRQVPGILAESDTDTADNGPYHDDWEHPSVYWISNGWNDIEGNMAAGAGSCGMCYWDVPAYVAGDSANEQWTGYASLQQGGLPGGGLSPLKVFDHNTCSTAQNGFMSVGSTSYCEGIGDGQAFSIPAVPNYLAPSCSSGTCSYYPGVIAAGQRTPTRCPDESQNCNTTSAGPNKVYACGYPDSAPQNAGEAGCMVNVLDHFTTSFNWTQTNFAAVWLRANWFLFTNGAITDQQHAGMTMIPGAGGYEQSFPGVWVLADKSVFIGHTQPQAGHAGFNPYASDAGQFVTDKDNQGNTLSGTTCDSSMFTTSFCNSFAEGVSVPFDGFATFQRMFSIYDGPAYQDANAFLDTNVAPLNGCTAGAACKNYPMALTTGIPKDQATSACYLQNAAIAWKQPNGFYYPPAFHSSDLFFNNVDIRHFVFQPEYVPGTYTDDTTEEENTYCFVPGSMFSSTGFTDIDRQTELSDDDGSLTGFVNSISVNEDPFFLAPYQTAECASNVGIGAQSEPSAAPTPAPPAATVDTSPYEYVTAAIYPSGGYSGSWSPTCETPSCTGIPLYREHQTGTEHTDATPTQFIRMAGEGIGQRSNLTINHGFYYIDTTTLETGPGSSNPFVGGDTYDVFFIFAKQETEQTYKMYVGPNFDLANDVSAIRVLIGTGNVPFNQTSSAWPGNWTRTYDPTSGLLTVRTNMSGFSDLIGYYPSVPATQSANTGLCQPSTFCSWNASGNSCSCSANSVDYPILTTDPNFWNECDSVCQNWAVKDLDCPTGGCYGFSVTFPSGFKAAPSPNPLPTPDCFPEDTNWTMPFGNSEGFDPANMEVAGACYYSSIPPSNFCSGADLAGLNGRF
jgi:hypothetical protein